jgi:hypothetical protein
MVPTVGYFYFGQDQRLESDATVSEATAWLLKKDCRNVLVEIANECDNQKYEQPSIQMPWVDALIKLAQSITVKGQPFRSASVSTAAPLPHRTWCQLPISCCCTGMASKRQTRLD